MRRKFCQVQSNDTSCVTRHASHASRVTQLQLQPRLAAQDTATPSINTRQFWQPPPPQSLVQDPHLYAQQGSSGKACMHFLSSGKTRRSEILPCQVGTYINSLSRYVLSRHPITFRAASSVALVLPVLIRIQRLRLITHSSKPLVRLDILRAHVG